MSDLSTVDTVSILLGWLRTHPAVLAAFGDPSHISGMVEGPWPHLRVIDGAGGDYGQMRWLITP